MDMLTSTARSAAGEERPRSTPSNSRSSSPLISLRYPACWRWEGALLGGSPFQLAASQLLPCGEAAGLEAGELLV